MKTSTLVLGLILISAFVEAQKGGCECGSSPCDDSETANKDCVKTPRPDCPCCLVCAHQEGQVCNELSQPCDLSQRLFCNATSSLCEKEKVTCLDDNGIEHQSGDSFNDGNCESRCTCTSSGDFVCQPLNCQSGLIKKGYLANDPLCEERIAPHSDNECCVLVVCATEAEEEEEEERNRNTENPGRSDLFDYNDDDDAIADDSEDRKVTDAENIQFLQITPTTVQVQFPAITGGNLMYVEDRLFSATSTNKGDIPWENAIILEGNKIFTLTGLNPGTLYRLRWLAPDSQYPDVEVSTQPLASKRAPKVIVTKKSFDSFTLSFDHFAPEDYNHGYVVLYKPTVSGGRWSAQEGAVGSKDLPSITVVGLKPNTQYEARIAIYEDFALRSYGKSTGVINVTTNNGCEYKDKAYGIGHFDVGCDHSCECLANATVTCGARCKPPLHKIGDTAGDPLCVEQPMPGDECCVIVTCAGNAGDENEEDGPCSEIKCGPNASCRHEVFRGDQAETICVCKLGYSGDPDSKKGCDEHVGGLPDRVTVSPKDGCVVKNETYDVGQQWNDGCEYTCTCSEKLEIICQPRCKELPDKPSEQCELRPHPDDDECCKVMYCPDPKSADAKDLKLVPEPFEGCVFKNATYEQGQRFYDGCEQQCQCIGFGDMICLSRCPPTAPAPGQNCYTLQDASDPCCNITVCDDPILDPEENVDKERKEPRIITTANKEAGGCLHNGNLYKANEEFYEGCDKFCMCTETGEAFCNKIKCPSSFGLDVINPFCLEWEKNEDFVASPPLCCPPVPQCKSDGACHYEGQKFNNYDNIPANMTGCEQRCYCENGEVLCQEACYEIPPEPPGYLSCSKDVAVKVPNSDRPCCETWGCPKLPDNIKIGEITLEPENATAVVLRVRVPRVLDGKAGYFKVFYTSGFQGHPDPEQWPNKVIHPDQGSFKVDDNGETRVVVNDLLPNQQYFLRVAMNIQESDKETLVMSDIISATTPPVQINDVINDIELRSIDVKLVVNEVTSDSGLVSWRFFSYDEKQFIDGVQIRFTRLVNGSLASGVPGTTPFIHRDTNFFHLADLKPNTEYQVDLYLIPVPKSRIELTSGTVVTFRTLSPKEDPYDFLLNLRADHIESNLVDLSWSGVPLPYQHYVNLYRILYMEENLSIGLDHHSAFIVSNIDSISSTRIGLLRPNRSYQIWLEAYLRNGKVAKSNVLSVKTLDGPDEASAGPDLHASDASYYNSMVIAAVIAALAGLALLIVLGFYLKRTTTYKAIISGNTPTNNKGAVKPSFRNRAFKASSTSIQMSPRKSNGVEAAAAGANNGVELNRNGDATKS